MDSLFEYTILAFVSLFVVIEPLSVAPIFLAMTPHDSSKSRIRMAKLACFLVALVLLLFAFSGSALLNVFGITLPAFQTAGGILLFMISLDMLKAQAPKQKITSEESDAGAEKDDIAVTPLAIPLLAGPGAISTSIMLANQSQGWEQKASLYTVIVFISLISYVILRLAIKGANWLNPIFLKVTTRLLGLILAALAVQFIFNGLLESKLWEGFR